MNYFELFDLPIAPIVDKSLLARRYFDLQKKNHPDFFTNATESEKEEALALSAEINKAFIIFKNNQKTLEYFLIKKKIILPNEKYILPNDFLMEMMEFNEELTDIDSSKAMERIHQYDEAFYTEIKEYVENYSSNFSEQEFLKMKVYYYKKKYLERILDRLAD